jgi:molybdopterin/thiamine biosynthesis adenylyltransferase
VDRVELKKAMDSTRFEYYERIAKLIADNEEVSLANLRRQHGLTYWAIDHARKMFKIRRKPGAGSAAYKKSTAATF